MLLETKVTPDSQSRRSTMRPFALLLLSLLLSLTPFQSNHAREFRAAWVASVFNINFPSRQGLSVEQQRQEIRNIVSTARAVGLNALIVQVRAESDALYESRYEPWARWLTGRQGANPGYDPLATFLEEGRRQGIEIHAWINPYRAAANRSHPRHASHPANQFGASLRTAQSMQMFDPGDPAVRAHVVRVVRDLVSRYPVAGVHLDDYFYPYPPVGRGVQPFDDERTYRAHGRGQDRNAWRRDNVNQLIRELSATVKSTRRGTAFGVSPFGIYTRGQPSDVKAGLDQLNTLHADPLYWMRNGWVDYLAPQLYWPDGGDQSFSSLLRWWRDPRNNPRQVPIYPGVAVDRMTSHGWSSNEIARQLQLERTIGPKANSGFILWNIKAVMNDTKGVRRVVASNR